MKTSKVSEPRLIIEVADIVLDLGPCLYRQNDDEECGQAVCPWKRGIREPKHVQCQHWELLARNARPEMFRKS